MWFLYIYLHQTNTFKMKEKKIIYNIIRKEFDSLKGFWQHERKKDLIKCVEFIGYNNEAKEMKNDLH